MFKAKNHYMYIDVKGVNDNEYSCTLMKAIIRRNCDVDYRIINSMVNKQLVYGDENHKKCDYQLRLENYNLHGITQDFELLKAAGIIEHVVKPTNYIVY